MGGWGVTYMHRLTYISATLVDIHGQLITGYLNRVFLSSNMKLNRATNFYNDTLLYVTFIFLVRVLMMYQLLLSQLAQIVKY